MAVTEQIDQFLAIMRERGNPATEPITSSRRGWSLRSIDYHRAERSVAGMARRRRIGTYTVYVDTDGGFWRRIEIDSGNPIDRLRHLAKRMAKRKNPSEVIGPDGLLSRTGLATRLEELIAEIGEPS